MDNDITTYTTEQARALDTGCFLLEFAELHRESGKSLHGGAVLQLRSAGRLTGLIEQRDWGLNALVVRLPDAFEPELALLARSRYAIEPRTPGSQERTALFVLRGGRCRVALRTDQCFALKDGMDPAGLMLCLWAANSIVVRRLGARDRLPVDAACEVPPPPAPTLSAEPEFYVDLVLDHIDAAAQMHAAIDAAKD